MADNNSTFEPYYFYVSGGKTYKIADPNEAPEGHKVYRQSTDVKTPRAPGLMGGGTADKETFTSDGSKHTSGKNVSDESYQEAKAIKDSGLPTTGAQEERAAESPLETVRKQQEASKVQEAEGAKDTPVKLNGMSTDAWVKAQLDAGKTKEEIMDMYEKEGFSRNGPKFTAALEKYSPSAQEEAKTEETTEGTTEEKPEEKTAEDFDTSKDDVPETTKQIKQFGKDLNRFVIQAYANGDFGNPKSWNAKLTMGYFLLDKIGNAIVNGSLIARGMQPTQKDAWSKVLDKQTELLGNDITAKWWNSKDAEDQKALLKTGAVQGTTAATLYENTDETAVENAQKKDKLEVSKLTQEQKGIAQQNLNALIARKTELQSLLSSLSADMGWDSYIKAMDAVVGTAKGLSSIGVTEQTNTSSQKAFSDSLNVDVKAGRLPSLYVSGGVSNNSTWNNSSAEALAKGNSASKDALALSKFQSGEAYANASQEAKLKANEELKANIEKQIDIIDQCIKSWGSDLGVK